MTALSSEAVVAVIGAGAMGSGIAQVAAVADHRVLLFDANPDAPAKAVAGIAKGLAGQVEKGRMSADKRQGVLDRLKPITSLGEAAGAALAIEAVVEDLAIKQQLF